MWLSGSRDFFHLVWTFNCEVCLTNGGVSHHRGLSAKWRAGAAWQIRPRGNCAVVGKRGTSQTPGSIWFWGNQFVSWLISDGSWFMLLLFHYYFTFGLKLRHRVVFNQTAWWMLSMWRHLKHLVRWWRDNTTCNLCFLMDWRTQSSNKYSLNEFDLCKMNWHQSLASINLLNTFLSNFWWFHVSEMGWFFFWTFYIFITFSSFFITFWSCSRSEILFCQFHFHCSESVLQKPFLVSNPVTRPLSGLGLSESTTSFLVLVSVSDKEDSREFTVLNICSMHAVLNDGF